MRRRSVRLHELSARDVVARAEASKLGKLADLLFSPDGGDIRYLLVETASGLAGLIRHKNYVAHEDVLGIGADAVVVRDRASLKDDTAALANSGLASAAAIKNRPVVTDTGEKIGQVVDYELDPEAGRLLTYVIAVGDHGSGLGLGIGQPTPAERVIPVRQDVVVGDELITVPMSVVIDSEPDPGPTARQTDDGMPGGDALATDGADPGADRGRLGEGTDRSRY